MSAARTRIEFESLSSMLDDGLMDLLEEDYAEVENTPFALDIDWDTAFACERLGTFRVIGLRHKGVHLVGYNAFHIAPHFHSRSVKTAINDVVFVARQFRPLGLALIRRSEALLRDIGVRQIFYASKVHAPHLERTGDLFAKLGYENTERLWRKVL